MFSLAYFKTIKTQFSSVLFLLIIIFLLIAGITYRETGNVNEQWNHFQTYVAQRMYYLEEIRTHLGYGGMIHHFKNLVLRKQTKYVTGFNESFNKLQTILTQYRQLPDVTPDELKFLEEVQKVANAYQQNLQIVIEMGQAEQSIADIDATVKVDDTPALTALDQLDRFYKVLAQEETTVLEKILLRSRISIIATVFITLCLLIPLMLTLSRRVIQGLSNAITVADHIANGKLDNQIKITHENEIGQLSRALAHMQQQLQERITKDKRIAEEALRITSALDNVTTAVLIADNHYKLIYSNHAATRLFTQETQRIRKDPYFQSFNAENLVGQPIDIFYHDPEKQRALEAALISSHRFTLTMGETRLDTYLTPVINTQGKRLGTVAEFNNITEQLLMEQEINAVIHAATQGDFQQRINLEGKTGFLKIVSESLNQIITVNQQAVQDTMRVFAALAKGDLTQSVQTNYVGAFAQLRTDANATVQKLTDVICMIRTSADTVNKATEELSEGTISLSQRTEQQAASLEETAASMEEMTSTVQQNADNAYQATQLATVARQKAELGGEVVGEAIKAMNAINQSSQQITDIIGVIDDIAFQTNLLALNAAVEAARAGEQGRGFAVVATEVRNLAQRSAAAAKEIKALIRDSVVKVTEGGRLVNQSGETLTDIVNAVKKVSDIIAEISAASQEQSAGIHQVNKAVSQMDEMTQQNASLVEESTSTSQSLMEQVRALKQQVSFFKVAKTLTSPPTQTPTPTTTKPKTPSTQHRAMQKDLHPHATKNSEWKDF
ncbi:methyl-accepting chemotaxis protein [Beggiatoa alba B18LD]|uniref:Methyl-accepting chemotaxis protein n=1 Tax=Beggiatoa alba B18LD TaxID=395493 RepID=I3CFP7_9GAMM|nr:methyl-accepting chemotaxis protein [Beggiatoa alba]EIJ42440.1 methyl-accepting chemotaxis protein [Beggiatoa alba B18LD]